MRFQTIIASVLILALASSSSLVAAQNSTAPTITPACQSCLIANIKGVTSCASSNVDPSAPGYSANPTSADKVCLCALSTNTSWSQPCASANTCGPTIINQLVQGLPVLKQQYCPGAGAAASSATAVASTSKTAGVALAFAAVFAQALL